MIGTTELIVIFLIILLVFGAGKIPKIAKDLGSGIKEFKKAMNDTSDSSDNSEKKNS